MPDAILFKPDPLTDAERAIMERHPVIGWEILRDVDFLGEAKLVVRSHHSAGRPRLSRRLARDEIPIAARVFAVADTYDALTTDRPYRRGWTPSAPATVVRENSGSQFDPAVVDAFMDVVELSDLAAHLR